MIPVETIFPNWQLYQGDVYVADYTNLTQNMRKLEISDVEPMGIDYFVLKNRIPIPVYGVNFEENPAFVAGSKMCECLFTPQRANSKPWVMLLEMKYCELKNLNHNAEDAFVQLKSSLAYLETKGVIDAEQHRVYLVVSLPMHTEHEPFMNFRITQEDSLRAFEEKGVHVLGVNSVLIATPNYLFEQKKKV